MAYQNSRILNALSVLIYINFKMVVALAEQITPEYGLVLLVSVILGFQCVLFGFIFPGRARKVFNKAFMKENFSKIHN